MLFNFCDPRLRPEIQCSTVSTEGHDVTNLINNSDKGFLAYSCIKPPVNIDITFLCNICINHIIIWPCVGSQKSSGFQLYAKSSNDSSVPYSLLSTGCLGQSDTGVLFYPSSVNHETIPGPPNFLKRYIKSSLRYLTNYTSNIRIIICKTENSVPALGKVQVWGTVSPRCGNDIIASVHILWSKHSTPSPKAVSSVEHIDPHVAAVSSNRDLTQTSLEIPEYFLDAITWDIMVQPIMLPSGKIIDQSTLQKHEENEALWGRGITDPFTGLPFSENRKPIVATALKLRIDKFLLENSNAEEVKRLPRVLGRALPLAEKNPKIVQVSNNDLIIENPMNKNLTDSETKVHSSMEAVQKDKKYCHKLPVVIMPSKKNVADKSGSTKRRKLNKSSASVCNRVQDDQIAHNCTETKAESTLGVDMDTVVPNLKRFGVLPEIQEADPVLNSCMCCTNGIFYQLPCKHVLCRKILTSIENNLCTQCGKSYKNSEVERIYE